MFKTAVALVCRCVVLGYVYVLTNYSGSMKETSGTAVLTA